MPPYNIMSTAAPRGEEEERSFTLQAGATWREQCNCKFFTQVAELVASTPLQSPAGWYLSRLRAGALGLLLADGAPTVGRGKTF